MLTLTARYAYLAPKHLKRQFADITSDTIDKQAEYFLKSFVKEFEGRAPEILEMAEEFKAYLPDDTDAAAATALEHFQAHVFLERKGQTLSVLELREVMRHICAFSDLKKFSFIEYLVWTFQKTLRELFEVKPYDLEPLLKGLYQAMHDYQESKAQHDAKTEEIEEMIKEADDKGQVVKGKVWEARQREVITRGATKRNRDAVFHKYKQQKAQKAYEKRKADELAAKKEKEKAERKAAKERMAARLGAAKDVHDE